MSWNIRTDLAIENREIYQKAEKVEDEIPGIKTDFENVSEDLKVTKVEIISEEGEKALGKPIGKYYTLEADNMHLGMEEISSQVENKISSILKELLQLSAKDKVLVVGLGNEEVTPDSLGPKVISRINITSHLIKYVPQYINEDTRSVSAIVPGVLGTTGIETSDIIKAVSEKTTPDKIIVIDALAARNIKRIKNTIQISDTGIIPGAGVGNNRQRLNKETIGIPVVAIGVPTVVDSKTIVSDVIEGLIEENKIDDDKKEDYYKYIQKMLPEIENNSIVTPTEIDEVIANISEIIANGINMALN
ncbi:MAG: GPR endopeptidase [Clostridia bacterium]|nr:GPR endopeptidase [Clostridia bacterium]